MEERREDRALQEMPRRQAKELGAKSAEAKTISLGLAADYQARAAAPREVLLVEQRAWDGVRQARLPVLLAEEVKMTCLDLVLPSRRQVQAV